MLHRRGRCWTFRLCMTCGRLMFPFQRAHFTECGPNTENAYHIERGCVMGRRAETMKQERGWAAEARRRAEEMSK